jgi:hypothetical protein
MMTMKRVVVYSRVIDKRVLNRTFEELNYERTRSIKRIRNAAIWFYIIAFATFINSIFFFLDYHVDLIVGLEITRIIEVIFYLMKLNRSFPVLLNILISCIIFIFGIYSNKKREWAFTSGIFLYLIDIFLLVYNEKYFEIFIHLIVLFFILPGSISIKILKAIEIEKSKLKDKSESLIE